MMGGSHVIGLVLRTEKVFVMGIVHHLLACKATTTSVCGGCWRELQWLLMSNELLLFHS